MGKDMNQNSKVENRGIEGKDDKCQETRIQKDVDMEKNFDKLRLSQRGLSI